MSEHNIQNSPIVQQLARLVDELGSQRAVAKALGSEGFQSSISSAINGKRMPSEAVRKALDSYCCERGIDRPEAAEAPPDTVVFSVILQFARDTPNTYRYNAIDDAAAMKSAYLQKSEVGPDAPEFIEIFVKSLVA